ncbi:hypothetical protein DSO57_1012271 [Entomophthora muscae]|uniref:Uncharacterized protein n=1 Tax=Entomophthora muscae TaxID=34485 RepID=A0ACC2RX55_9FUNG|nr:hypothetical protein DSO57_1012271 [Entomophthora muscae]
MREKLSLLFIPDKALLYLTSTWHQAKVWGVTYCPSDHSWTFGKDQGACSDTGADANFIEEKLAKLLGLPTSQIPCHVKVGNSTLIGATPILQPVTIDLEGSPFCIM